MKFKETVVFITKAPDIGVSGAVQIAGEGTPYDYEPSVALDITVYKEGRSAKQIMEELKSFEVLRVLPQVGIKINIK